MSPSRTTAVLLIGLAARQLALAGGNSDMAAPTEPSSSEFLVGGDISALTVIEDHGGVYRDGGQAGDAIEIMARHGCNCFRLRLFVNPPHENTVVNDLPYTIALAKRIKATGAKLLLNFHYSDTWADPGHQTKPDAWKDLEFDSLEQQVYDYTRDCIAAFRAESALPDLVQIGNEINPGMLWPDGKLYGVGDPDEQWQKFSRLLKAGVKGVRDASGEEPIRIAIHIATGGSWPRTKWFFERIEKHEVPYDVIALSFYPWWHGTIDDLRENLRNAAAAFDKDLFVVETAYPYRSFERAKPENWRENMTWPMTPDGQRDFTAEIVRCVRETPNRRGLGVLWWFPESIPVHGLRIWHGGATALFDRDGNALPAIDALRN